MSAWRDIRIEHSQGILKIRRIGNFNGQPIRNLEVLGVSAAPREMRADGLLIEFRFDQKGRRLSAVIPENASEITLSR
jgi:hypothetical protein